MSATRAKAKPPESGSPPENSASVRASISFPPDRYATLEQIAKQKKVSLAWVVREAVDTYIEAKWPLFPPSA